MIASGLPTVSAVHFLQAYPLPSFALPVPPRSPPHTPTLSTLTRTASPDIPLGATHSPLPPPGPTPPSPPPTPLWDLAPLWANRRWRRAARGRPLRDCLSSTDARALLEWLYLRGEAHCPEHTSPAHTPTADLESSPWDACDADDRRPGRSPDIDLSTREGVRRWAASVGAPVRPHSTPVAATAEWTGGRRGRRAKSLSARPRARTPAQDALPSITLDFAFPGSRQRVELVCTLLPADDCQVAVLTFARSTRWNGRLRLRRRLPSVAKSDTSVPTDEGPGALSEVEERVLGSKELAERRSTHPVVVAAEKPHRPSLPALPRPTPMAVRGSRQSAASEASAEHEHAHGEISASLLPSQFMSDDNATTTTIGGEFTPGQPIFIAGDGSIKAAPAESMPKASKDPLSVASLLQNTDWSRTPLGPLERWPVSLRSIVSMMSVFPLGTAVFWGRELTFLYNQAYSQFTPNHPQLFGVHGADGMRHLQSSLGGQLLTALLKGSSIYKDDEFYLRRDPQGHMRESYRSLLWAPIKNEKGHYGGIWHATRDTTPKVLADRRLSVIRDLSGRTSTSRTLHEFERGILETLHAHPKDTPFAMMYFVDEPGHRGSELEPRIVRMRLAGTVGVPTEHPSTPELVAVHIEPQVAMNDDEPLQPPPNCHGEAYPHGAGSPVPSYSSTVESTIGSSDPGWQFAEVLASRQSVVVNCKDLIDDFSVRVWDELPDEAVVIPLTLNSEAGLPSAVLVLGLSARLEYDAAYRVFIEDLRFNIASYLSAVRSYDADQRRLGDLTTLDRAKSLLFSNVSHELLAPLTIIAGPLDDVIIDLPDGRPRESLVMARRNVSRLTRLVSMLVDISNLEAGRLLGSFTKVNLGIVTRDVAGQFRKVAARTPLRYTIQCDETPRNVYVDRERWEKILFCLVENALKYTTHGFVKVSLEYTHKQAVLTVADSGVGIASSNVEELNQGIFPRASSAVRTVANAGSSGISLTFAKKLVQLHHGEFEIESKTARESGDGSHGTVFRVRIPLGCAHLPPELLAPTHPEPVEGAVGAQFGREMLEEVSMWHTEREQDAESTSAAMSVSSQETKRSRGIDGSMLNFTPQDVVMIVEDMPDAQRYMRTIFEPFCKVVVVKNGLEALGQYDAQPPDVIISDVMLPGMSGMELLDALRAGTREQRLVPVILLAAADDVRTNCMLRADDYISKPFNARELIVRTNMQLQMGKERRTLEQLFDERTQELRLLSDHSPAGILRCDEAGTLIYANLAWRKMGGVPVGEALIAPDYVHDDSKEELLAAWKRFVESDESVVNMQVRWKNGRWTSFKLARVDNAAPGKGGFIGSAIDITERQLNEELQAQRIAEAEKRRAEAEEARQQQELLIDITSHEIRNPISSILQCSSMVRSNLLVLREQLQHAVEAREAVLLAMGSRLPVEARQSEEPSTPGSFQPTRQLLVSLADDLEALDSIYQCGLAQERISNDVLSLGKMQLDLLHMFDVETSIPTVARKVLSIFQNEARMNRINLQLNISDSFDRLGINSVMTDPVRLSQIVTNLLSNAIRFTANSRERRIELHVDASLQPPTSGTCLVPPPGSPDHHLYHGRAVYVYMSVSDTGPGLTPVELERLFQRFAQASPMTHTVFGGSGLGLFVCRKLAERMGGQIEVASEYGKGSQFRFFIRTTLPVPKVGRGRLGPTGGCISPPVPLARRVRDKTPKSPQRARKLRLLVVEDNLINRTVLLRQLKHVGIAAESASNGHEAVIKLESAMAHDAVEGEGFDCVLMDLEMPVMDGYTAARKIRSEEADGRLRRSVIIALTGNARQAQIREGMADFDAAVIKPYRLDDLLRQVEELVDGHGHEGANGDTNEAGTRIGLRRRVSA